MAKARMGLRLAACVLLSSSGAVLAAPPPQIATMLSFRPKQEGVVYAIPTSAEQDACKVELIGGGKQGSGWLLRDGRGLPLRRFVETTGTPGAKVDLISYYQDGVEVYREHDSNHNQKFDQFRWLNAGGSKWGVDRNEDGKIDSWLQISAEEVSQEALQALITRDLARLSALFVTEAEIKALGMPAAEAQRLQQLQSQAAAKVQALLAKLPGLNDKTQWVRLEAGIPQSLPAGDNGYTQDVVKYVHATVLYENAGKHDFIQLGDLVLAGKAWRLTEAPSLGDEPASAAPQSDPQLQKLLDELRVLDDAASKVPPASGANPAAVRYNLDRADLIGKIMAKDRPDQAEQWLRQQAESLSAASQNSPPTDMGPYQRLVQLKQQVEKDHPGSNLAAFVAFREIQAEYASKGTAADAQTHYLTRLTGFVKAFPRSEDTPEAMMQLGMVGEFVNKEGEAKNWYDQLAKGFPTHPLAAKAQGAIRRLSLEGHPLELSGAQATGGAFDISQLRGKYVAVYYWASWDQQFVGDFARLKLMADKYASQGFTVVCVNLDNGTPQTGGVPVPGIQLVQQGGLDGPLATHYGIMTLPNLFLVGKDGKVLSRTVQVGTLEDELKKNLK